MLPKVPSPFRSAGFRRITVATLPVLASCFAFAATPAAPPVPEDPGGAAPLEVSETRVNLFTVSAQAQVALDAAPGAVFAAWSSRRQEAGTYGVFARRLDALGRPRSHEVRLNETVAGSQASPAVAAAEDGSVWFAWKSVAPGGEAAILARRFGADLEPLTAEIRLSRSPRPPTAPALAAGEAGRAFVVWGERGAGGSSRLRGRWIEPTGRLRPGDHFSTGPRQVLGAPTVTALSGSRMLVVWAQGKGPAAAAAIAGQRVGRGGRSLGRELLLASAPGPGAGPIEPSVAADSRGRFTVAWLEPKKVGYEVRARRFSREGRPLGEILSVAGAGRGWKSGVAVAMAPMGSFVVSYGDEAVGEPSRVYARRFDAHGTPLEAAPRLLTDPGRPARAEVSGARRAAWPAAGHPAFAWTGEGAGGDPHGAHVAILRPAGQGSETGAGDGPAEAWEAAPAVPSEVIAAAVPIYDPDFVPQGRDAALGAGGDFGFVGVPSAPWTPPDPELAVGPDRIVVITNGNISAFDKTGTLQWTDEIENSFGFWGDLGADNLVFDPEVIWDLHDSRFVAMANERSDDNRAFFLLAISRDMTPDDEDDWHKYRIDVTALVNGGIDSPNLAVNRDFVFLTADFFGPDRYLLFIVDKAPLLSGGPVSSVDELISGAAQQSMGIPTVASDTSDLYILQAREGAVNDDLVIHAITDPFTDYDRRTFSLPVPSYSFPVDPPQAGTSTRPELFEPRIWSVMEVGGFLWAVHHVDSTRARVRWYQIALNGWPASGTPSLVQDGELDLGDGIHTFFPSIFADAAGNAAITFARSAMNESISMGRALRAATDPPGTFRPVQVVQTSPNGTAEFRWGDYSGTHSDPETPGRFWGHHEFSSAGPGTWQTWVARYDLRAEPMLLSAGLQVTGATPGATVRLYGTPTGTGLTTVAAMNVTLSLENAVEIEAAVANSGGVAAFSGPVPGGTVLVQAAEDGFASQWREFIDVIFADGFETGDTSPWSQSVGRP